MKETIFCAILMLLGVGFLLKAKQFVRKSNRDAYKGSIFRGFFRIIIAGILLLLAFGSGFWGLEFLKTAGVV